MKKLIILLFFISVSIVSFAQTDSTNVDSTNIKYTEQYIQFNTSVDIKLYDMKGSLLKELTSDRVDIQFLPRGIYVVWFDDKSVLYLKQR